MLGGKTCTICSVRDSLVQFTNAGNPAVSFSSPKITVLSSMVRVALSPSPRKAVSGPARNSNS
jgi:hypothetical protein